MHNFGDEEPRQKRFVKKQPKHTQRKISLFSHCFLSHHFKHCAMATKSNGDGDWNENAHRKPSKKSNGDDEPWDENAHRKASKINMHNDRFKPTEFTHEQWIELRNWLFETGRPYRFKDDKDHRKRLYRFAMMMNQMQQFYGVSLRLLAIDARIGLEAYCFFLQDYKLK